MNSSPVFAGFRPAFNAAPRKNYRIWKQDPSHPSVQFKRVGRKKPVYSVRVGIGWRALGIRLEDAVVRFWIGSHAEYERLLQEL